MNSNNNKLKVALPILSLLTCAFIFAFQDIYISDLVKSSDPLVLVFWIFLVVTIFSIVVAITKSESFKLRPSGVSSMIGLNFTTAISWIFTFLALSKSSPAVVSAATLSTPLVIIMILLEGSRRLNIPNVVALTLIIVGLIIGIFDNPNATIEWQGLIYCILASIGVVGNSIYMKKLTALKIQGNVALSLRFIGLLLALSTFFIIKSGNIPTTDESALAIIALALATTYIPLWLIYFSHWTLDIYIINLTLALTPVATLILLAILKGFETIKIIHLVSIALVVTGVLIGFKKGGSHA